MRVSRGGFCFSEGRLTSEKFGGPTTALLQNAFDVLRMVWRCPTFLAGRFHARSALLGVGSTATMACLALGVFHGWPIRCHLRSLPVASQKFVSDFREALPRSRPGTSEKFRPWTSEKFAFFWFVGNIAFANFSEVCPALLRSCSGTSQKFAFDFREARLVLLSAPGSRQGRLASGTGICVRIAGSAIFFAIWT